MADNSSTRPSWIENDQQARTNQQKRLMAVATNVSGLKPAIRSQARLARIQQIDAGRRQQLLGQRGKRYAVVTDAWAFGNKRLTIVIKDWFRSAIPSLITQVKEEQSASLGDIYLGPIQAWASLQTLQEKMGKAVFNRSLLSQPEAIASDLEDPSFKPKPSSDIQYGRLALFDHSFLDTDTGRVITLDKLGKALLEDERRLRNGDTLVVNCQAGKGRSSAYVQMLLITTYGKLPSEAAAMVRAGRSKAQVPAGFGLGKNLNPQQTGVLGNVFLAMVANFSRNVDNASLQAQAMYERLLAKQPQPLAREFLPVLAMDFGNMHPQDQQSSLDNFAMVSNAINEAGKGDILEQLTTPAMLKEYQANPKTATILLTNAAILFERIGNHKRALECAKEAMDSLPTKPYKYLSDDQIVHLFKVANFTDEDFNLGVIISRAVKLIKDPRCLGELHAIIVAKKMSGEDVLVAEQACSTKYANLSLGAKVVYVAAMQRASDNKNVEQTDAGALAKQLIMAPLTGLAKFKAMFKSWITGKPMPKTRLATWMQTSLRQAFSGVENQEIIVLLDEVASPGSKVSRAEPIGGERVPPPEVVADAATASTTPSVAKTAAAIVAAETDAAAAAEKDAVQPPTSPQP